MAFVAQATRSILMAVLAPLLLFLTALGGVKLHLIGTSWGLWGALIATCAGGIATGYLIGHRESPPLHPAKI